MNIIFGNLGPSSGGPYEINKNGLLKVLRTAVVTGVGAIAGFLVVNLAGFDWLSGTDLDTLITSAVFIPLLEMARRWATDYSA